MNWKKLVQDHHNWAHSDGAYELVIGDPVLEGEIKATGSKLDFNFPSEFVDFYTAMNGFGIKSEDHGTEWFFLPLEKILESHADTRDMLESHPEVGQRFIPFVDWLCGDFTGYLAPKGSMDDSRLFMLEHERFEYDSNQDPNEFVTPVYTSIEDLLTPDD